MEMRTGRAPYIPNSAVGAPRRARRAGLGPLRGCGPGPHWDARGECVRAPALYMVHPRARLKLWVLALRLTEPAFYGKATAFLHLRTLAAHMPRPPVPPQHVLDYDRAHD